VVPFYTLKRLQEFRAKAALSRDNEIIPDRQLHVAILCPVERDNVIENSFNCFLKSARTHDARSHLPKHFNRPPEICAGPVIIMVILEYEVGRLADVSK